MWISVALELEDYASVDCTQEGQDTTLRDMQDPDTKGKPAPCLREIYEFWDSVLGWLMVEGFTNLTGFKSNLVYTVREVGSALTLTVRGYIFNICDI